MDGLTHRFSSFDKLEHWTATRNIDFNGQSDDIDNSTAADNFFVAYFQLAETKRAITVKPFTLLQMVRARASIVRCQ